MHIKQMANILIENKLPVRFEIIDNNINVVFLKQNEMGEYVPRGYSFVFDMTTSNALLDIFEYHFLKAIEDMKILRML